MILQIFFHKEFSRLPTGLGHSADSNGVPQNLTTTSHPVQIATVLLMFLLLQVVQLLLQFYLFLIDEVLTCYDSTIILHRICHIPVNCLCKLLLASVTV